MSDTNCVFCHIIQGSIPAKVIYRDELSTAFWDKHPIAPVHILIVPNQHYDSLNQASESELLGHLLLTARQIAHTQGVDDSGYRLIINTGPDSRQSIFHLHVHLIAGKPLAFHVR